MRRLVLLVPLALGLAATIYVVAGASATPSQRTCKIDVTGSFVTVAVLSGNPPLSGTAQDVNTVDGKICGKVVHGAGRDVTTYTAPGVFSGKGVSFGPNGSTRNTFEGTGTVMPNGDITFSGSGTITGGTGRFKGASGSFTFTGSQEADSNGVSTQHLVGTITY